MKKLIIAGLLFASSIESNIWADSLISAIHSSNAEQVKLLLGTFGYLDSNYKSLLLNIAKEASVCAEKKLPFFRSPKDMALVAVGAIFLGAVIKENISPGSERINSVTGKTEFCKEMDILGSLLGIFGIYWGSTRWYACNTFKNAQQIYELIEQKPVRDELKNEKTYDA